VFAPVAAHLSLGVAVEQFGPLLTTMERLALPAVERGENRLTGSVIYIDHFGNLITNVTKADLLPFPRERLCVSINSVQIHGIITSYADVDVGAHAALINSWGMLEIAVRNGSAAQQLGVLPGCPVYLTTE
jgi:S-adenosylmethionine hydrolase